jgi:hypothetical protein
MVIYHIDTVIPDIDMGDEANDMGDDSMDTVISHSDMGYLVTLAVPRALEHAGVVPLQPRQLDPRSVPAQAGTESNI